MEPELVYKALANPARRQILQWLKSPGEHFDEDEYRSKGLEFSSGVCVGDIRAKTGLAQSVVSSYLQGMQRAGLLQSERIGKWTYYRRNEKAIREFADFVSAEL
ncbi:transcriptional regulator [Arthrobacter sp. MYb23]|uniref:ArsR/SmtB family transcription factor n=1 Tax=unclassified Arthrobacter TaxID=235627 RepID=UPI0004664BEA|nr:MULTISPECIES: helix-turn-helix domain-containing protein [unclassified Arthrobacter]PRB35884.1 transcriptional regulator [Arthrobacter sp. MYb51]PRB89259.1 transcriptional regulator [Arthrobacter sp. MYb23]